MNEHDEIEELYADAIERIEARLLSREYDPSPNALYSVDPFDYVRGYAVAFDGRPFFRLTTRTGQHLILRVVIEADTSILALPLVLEAAA